MCSTDYMEIVQIEIPFPTNSGNPWVDTFGMFKDDPTFDDLQAEIAAYRKELDQEYLAMEKQTQSPPPDPRSPQND